MYSTILIANNKKSVCNIFYIVVLCIINNMLLQPIVERSHSSEYVGGSTRTWFTKSVRAVTYVTNYRSKILFDVDDKVASVSANILFAEEDRM